MQPSGHLGAQNHPNQYLRKTQYDNFYDRKLAEEREMHQNLEGKLIMNTVGANLKQQMTAGKSRTIQLPHGTDLSKLTPGELQAL